MTINKKDTFRQAAQVYNAPAPTRLCGAGRRVEGRRDGLLLRIDK
jgi:hypothetical protein